MADNKGIPQELIDRINELSKKKKEEGLTSEELAEQKELRETYLSLFRENFRSHIEMLQVYDKNGKEVLFTKDHIFPHSKGGIDHISNYKTMCARCNVEKSNSIKNLSLKDRIRVNIIKTDKGKKLVTDYIVKHPVYQG